MLIHFTNLGCKLNQAEIEGLARDLVAHGHAVAEDLEAADLHVINSCTVTHAAARASRKAAGRGSRRRPGQLTVLTGCYATERPEEAAELAGVDLVVPNRDKDRLVELLHRAFPDRIPVPDEDGGFPGMAAALPTGMGTTRAMVKIEDGCNMQCSFCIIPAMRGRQRSRPVEEVAGEVCRLAGSGVREIVLTGVQISAYRADRTGPSGEFRLEALVRELLASALGDGRRLRLTSIAPWDLDDRLLGLWQDPRLCRHLHLSLQSGDSATLKRMRRPYTAERYADLLAKTRAAVPGVAVTTDVIVGFPGEDEREFESSLAFTEAAGFAKIHAFPFSSRPGTAAATLPAQVHPDEKKERMARMLAVAELSERRFWESHLGSRQTVLWEKPRGGVGQGLTDNYIRVLSPQGAALRNRFSEVRLERVADGGVEAEIVSLVGLAG